VNFERRRSQSSVRKALSARYLMIYSSIVEGAALETAARAQHVKVSPAHGKGCERRERFAASHAIKIKSEAREK
jgi:hypothetical protein